MHSWLGAFVVMPWVSFPTRRSREKSIVAVYAEEDKDNHGVPFFLGKVLSVSNKNKKDGDADKDDDESDEAPEYLVEFHEYIQTENNDGKPSGKYQLHNVDGERENGFESHNSQGGHFESSNRPNCVGDQEDEQQ